MGHIHHQPGQHDVTVSAYIMRLDGDQPRLLVHLHRTLGKWMHFGGHVELHETPWAAVIREIKEEGGYELSQLRLLQPQHNITDLGSAAVSHPLPFVLATYPYGADITHFHTDSAFVFTATEIPHHPVPGEESSDFKLLSREEIAQLSDEETFHNFRIIALHIFDHLLPGWQAVDPHIYETGSPVTN